MNFELTEEQIQVRDMVREFAAKEVAPYIREWDAKGEFHREVLDKMGELGILGLPIPERYGGLGLDYVTLALACEELEYVDTFLRVIMSVHVGLNSLPLLQWGNEEQKQRWLVPQAQGEKIATFGLTEPNAGSDAGAIESTVRSRGRSLHPQRLQDVDLAGRCRRPFPRLCESSTARQKHNGLTAFMLERGMPGFTTGTIKGKLGVRAGNTGELAFNNVRVPVENRIGEEGEGFKIAMSCIDQGRFTVGAGAVGLTRACLDASVKYANERDSVRSADRQVRARPADDRQDGARLRDLSSADDEGRRAQEPRRPQHARNLADEVARLRRRPGIGERCDPGPRLVWLLKRVPGRAVLAKRARRRDLRRHPRDPHHPAGRIRARLPAGQAAAQCRSRPRPGSKRRPRSRPTKRWSR